MNDHNIPALAIYSSILPTDIFVSCVLTSS